MEALKHGKLPTMKQKKRLQALGLNPKNWYITKDCPECFEIVHRVTKEKRRLDLVNHGA